MKIKQYFSDINGKYDERSIQKSTAPKLRKAAVGHLANGQGVVAKNFRGEYLASGLGDYKNFLNRQSQEGVWATYIEAAALGELLGYNIVVTPIKNGAKQQPICLYRAETDAKTIHLFNSNNTHWYTNEKTLGDGNCLYNAFTQALYTEYQQDNKEQSVLLEKQGFFNQQEYVINHQKAIGAAIFAQPSPSELEKNLESEKNRILSLPMSEQRQIQNDYKLALALAAEEMQKAYTSSPFNLTHKNSSSEIERSVAVTA